MKAPGGGDLAGKGLVGIDPARYGTLQHPGDGYSFDIYTQVARAIRQGGPPLAGLQPQRLIAAGESPAGIADSLGGMPAVFRTDQNVPVLDAQTESDTGLLNSLAARQPDDAHFRLWRSPVLLMPTRTC